MRAQMQALVDSELSLPESFVEVLPPGEESVSTPFLTLDAGPALPNWKLALRLTGPDPFATAAHRQVTLYLWTGLSESPANSRAYLARRSPEGCSRDGRVVVS